MEHLGTVTVEIHTPAGEVVEPINELIVINTNELTGLLDQAVEGLFVPGVGDLESAHRLLDPSKPIGIDLDVNGLCWLTLLGNVKEAWFG